MSLESSPSPPASHLPPRSSIAAVVVAAGRGERFGDPAKCLVPLAGRPMLAWSLDALERAATVEHVVVVAGAHTRAAIEALVAGLAWPKVVAVVEGGERRQDSVAAGFAAVPAAAAILVHDAARPLADPALFDRCAAAALAVGAAIAAIPVADTLKRVADDRVAATVDRAGLWAAQTPQGFRQDIVQRLLPAIQSAATVTDEAALCEALGLPVAVVPGSPANLKVTRPDDVAVAAALLQARTPSAPRTLRSGIGYDVHRLMPGRRLVLGGVEIAHERGLEGHSDADVLLHAIADALLGAAALGDIGRHFPPSDPRYAGADSRDLLRQVGKLLAGAGYRPLNVDATVIAEAPRLGPHVPAMQRAIAACLDLPPDAVSVKATTNEGLGFAGRGEGIAAFATALIGPVG